MPSRSRHDPPLEVGREEPVVPAQQEARRHVGPGVERPRRLHRRSRLGPLAARHRLGHDRRIDVVEELLDDVELAVDVATLTARELAPVVLPARVAPPVAGRLAGARDHRGDEDHQLDRPPRAHDRRGEPRERLGDQDHVVAVADRGEGGVGVLGEAGRVVVTREIGCDDVVSAGSERGRDEVPVPRIRRCSVEQGVAGHGETVLRAARVVASKRRTTTSRSRLRRR